MKKILILLIISLCLSLIITACGGNSVSQDEHDKLRQELDELREALNQTQTGAAENSIKASKLGKWEGRTIDAVITLTLNADDTYTLTQQIGEESDFLQGTYTITETTITLQFIDEKSGLDAYTRLEYETKDKNIFINFGNNNKISFSKENTQ